MGRHESRGGHDGSLRERKKQQTRRAIHEAALNLVEEAGLDATTIEQICAMADVSPRTFFNYYPTKSAAVLGLTDTPITDQAAARFRAAEGGLVAALCEVIMDGMENNSDTLRVKHLAIRRPELVPEFTQWVGQVREQFFQLAQERAASREEAVAAATLVMAGMGLAMQDRHHNETLLADALDRAIDRLVASRQLQMTPRQAG
ncbi:TetR/AcrR family transcriptional regulator [Propionibacterium sp.]|uniref:TetR/AcrR family transcriptional regulator n=1 Tax=Propionibacterium sp. TaxID=1977903 RepID=UPI0039E940AE